MGVSTVFVTPCYFGWQTYTSVSGLIHKLVEVEDLGSAGERKEKNEPLGTSALKK